MEPHVEGSDPVPGTAETLGQDVNRFAASLPYWIGYLADRLLKGQPIAETALDQSYKYLLEDLNLEEQVDRVELEFKDELPSNTSYGENVHFARLEEVEGVNALAEGQVIEFIPQLTILYGANASGKSGYSRLLKEAFYSRDKEEIEPNVRVTDPKDVAAKFTFLVDGQTVVLGCEDANTEPVFDQFAVFDEKCVLRHLDDRNDFEFRPSGLSFFSSLNELIKKVEAKLHSDIKLKQTSEDFTELFDGETAISIAINGINPTTDVEVIKAFLPVSPKDVSEKARIQKEYDDLFVKSKTTETTLKQIDRLLVGVSKNKSDISSFNRYFTSDSLEKVIQAIRDHATYSDLVRQEGITNIDSGSIENVGSPEWRSFIIAAQDFANSQHEASEESTYPESGDHCLLCHQPLSSDAQELISKTWEYLKSEAEGKLTSANVQLNKIIQAYSNLNLDSILVENETITWLKENYKDDVEEIEGQVTNLKSLVQQVVACCTSRTVTNLTSVQISTSLHDTSTNDLNAQRASLTSGQSATELARLSNQLRHYAHQQKLSDNFTRIELFIQNIKWISTAASQDWRVLKQGVTLAEKRLSEKYYNAGYVARLNDECERLEMTVDISVDPKGADGKSNRKLLIRDKNPSVILSEGEQKVVALADFLSEMDLSEVNKGLIFDDPVTSLDHSRKTTIAKRLVEEATHKQIVIFTHDLAFVYYLMEACESIGVPSETHWVEKVGGEPGNVWLRNSPSMEQSYKDAKKADEYLQKAKASGPSDRVSHLKNGFSALRTSYEALVVYEMLQGVVQRFDERVRMDIVRRIMISAEHRDIVMQGFDVCCKFMEGHSHPDASSQDPEIADLQSEIERYNAVKRAIRQFYKDLANQN